MRPKRPRRPPPPPPPSPAVVTPESLAAINQPEVDKLPAYISVGKFQWKPPLPGPKGDTGAPGAPGVVTRPISPAIVAAEIATDAVETAKIKDAAVTPAKLSFVPAAGYVPRQVAAPDYTHITLPTGNALYVDGLDLSAIVPAGATGVVLGFRGVLNAPGDYIEFFTNQTGGVFNNERFINEGGVSIGAQTFILPIDPDRKLDYNSWEGFAGSMMFDLTVQGWFI